jgi:hypothetical protein
VADPPGLFLDLYCHGNFEDHQAAAGREVVTCDDALEAWVGEDRVIVPNKSGRAAPYLFRGVIANGRGITVAILESTPYGAWMAYTAWYR